MSELTAADLVEVVQRWQTNRIPLAQKFTNDGLAAFVAAMNGMSRELISKTGKYDPEFWSAWIELGQQCSTFTRGGKVFVGETDRTND